MKLSKIGSHEGKIDYLIDYFQKQIRDDLQKMS